MFFLCAHSLTSRTRTFLSRFPWPPEHARFNLDSLDLAYTHGRVLLIFIYIKKIAKKNDNNHNIKTTTKTKTMSTFLLILFLKKIKVSFSLFFSFLIFLKIKIKIPNFLVFFLSSLSFVTDFNFQTLNLTCSFFHFFLQP